MKKIFRTAVFILIMAAATVYARPLRVVTTLPELADIAGEVGGSKVSATHLMRGNQDAHYIEPRPSMARRMRDADLLIINGMELDVWIFSLIDAARNPRIVYGRNGYLDVSAAINKMEVLPAGARIDGSMGHVHAGGNPHYTVDPLSGKIVARQIMERLSLIAPEHGEYFRKNYEDFSSRIDERMGYWQGKLDGAGIDKIVTYHKNWPYFARTFGIEIVGEMEPLPGIPPSPAHLSRLVEKMKAADVKVVMMVNFYDIRPARFIQERTGARVARVPMHVGGSPEARCYISLIDTIVNNLAGY